MTSEKSRKEQPPYEWQFSSAQTIRVFYPRAVRLQEIGERVSPNPRYQVIRQENETSDVEVTRKPKRKRKTVDKFLSYWKNKRSSSSPLHQEILNAKG